MGVIRGRGGDNDDYDDVECLGYMVRHKQKAHSLCVMIILCQFLFFF